MQSIRAVTLDLDDTLWAVGPVIAAAEAELWRWLDRHYPAIGATFSRTHVAQLRDRVVEEHADKTHDLSFIRKQILRRLATGSGYSDDWVDEAFAVFARARNRVELYPDVVAGLTQLTKNYPLVALTNGNADVSEIGLQDYFLAVVTSAQVGVAKPGRDMFAAAAAELGLSMHALLHVGDDPEVDVVGAARAGLHTAWMNRRGDVWPKELPPPDFTVSSLHGVCEALDGLGP